MDNFGNSSGSLCDPWSCSPSNLTILPGSKAQLVTRGAPLAPHFLLVAGPTAQCVPVPGFARSLIVQPPVVGTPLSLTWGKVTVNGPPPTCGGWIGFARFVIPARIPAGSQFLLQAVVASPKLLSPTFSNAIAITSR